MRHLLDRSGSSGALGARVYRRSPALSVKAVQQAESLMVPRPQSAWWLMVRPGYLLDPRLLKALLLDSRLIGAQRLRRGNAALVHFSKSSDSVRCSAMSQRNAQRFSLKLAALESHG